MKGPPEHIQVAARQVSPPNGLAHPVHPGKAEYGNVAERRFELESDEVLNAPSPHVEDVKDQNIKKN